MNRKCLAVALLAAIGFGERQTIFASDIFEKPVRLMADGRVIDTGEAWGHSSPCVEDIDGDGLDDLLLGDFSGKFHVYKNVGEKNRPAYKDAGKLKAGDTDASVRIYCCVGGQPRFVDLDGDGTRDFISSSYDPGHCYFFRGLPDRKFAASTELVDEAGVPVRSSPQQKQNFQSFGSFFAPADWDADGDFDILIGCFDGHLKLRINEGDAKKPRFATENKTVDAGGEPLKVEAHCCPVVADWDSDGLWDVVAGCDDGSVTWFRNVGSKEAPKFEKGKVLVEKHDGNGYNLLRWSEKEVVPGIRAQVEVVDYNGDGKLDLLVGDFCTAYELKSDLSDEQKTEFVKLIHASQESDKALGDKMKSLRKDFAERYPGDAIYGDEATAEWSKAYQALRESPESKESEKREAEFVRQVRPFLASTRGNGERSFDLAKSHGYVWLFIRK
jgi:hypothetical protein